MFRILILVLIFVNQNYASEVFDEFVKFHDWMQNNRVYQLNTEFQSKDASTNFSSENSVLLITTKEKVIFLQEKNKEPILFFNSSLGSWITKQELPTPLKVSGAYNVFGIMNIDDVTSLNYKDTYKVEKEEKTSVLLKAQKNTATYQYISLQKLSPTRFEAIYMDIRQTPVKKALYHVGTVNGQRLIEQADFNDLLINTNRSASYRVKNVKTSNVPVSVLSPERFSSLFNIFQKIKND